MKIAALLANGAKVSDSEAAALVSAGRVQIRWRETAPDVVIDLGDVEQGRS